MSSRVQTAHTTTHHQFHTIHSYHSQTQYQEPSKMAPEPNSDDHVMKIHPLRQPSVATSRQVSQDSDISNKDYVQGMKTPKHSDGTKILNCSSSRPPFVVSDQASVMTPRESYDRDQVTPVITASNSIASSSSSSTKISIPGATNSCSNSKINNDDVVRQAACTTKVSSSTHVNPSQVGTNKETANPVVTYTGSGNIAPPVVASQSTIPPSTIKTQNTEDPSSPPSVTISGTKRKISSSVDTSFSPSLESSQCNSPMSRRDSLPMGLRNKKMKATDCLLFAATLLEQDAAEALVASSKSPNTSNNRSAVSNGILPATNHPVKSFVPTAVPFLPVKKTKPLKKMMCEKIERSLQEDALRKMQQLYREQQNEQQEQDDEDCENKPKDADVLCGRGGKVNKHPGNIIYRKVVEYNKSYYQSVHKKHRILVSQSIVKAILNYGGRFMGQKGKEWTPICFKRAVQKTSQALRERSNTSDIIVQGLVGDYNNSKQQFLVETAGAKK